MNWTYWVYLFTSFQGRINREPFWIGYGILAAVEIATQWLADQVAGEIVSNILGLAFTYSEFAIAVKRSNDRNLSPWIVALWFAGLVAVELFTLMNGEIDTANPVNVIILLPIGLLGAILIGELGFRRGTSGPNRFGPDPLSDSSTTPSIFR
jgi:uncharacterized membrane protein YhaH (DUF805 family)